MDRGYAQYVKHEDIFLIFESSPRVWDDVPLEYCDFTRRYMDAYPVCPMVNLRCDQVIKTEWNGKWKNAEVKEIDASMVKMYWEADDRTEWIYRGSCRLGPMLSHSIKENQHDYHNCVNTPNQDREGVFTNVCFVFDLLILNFIFLAW